MKPTRIFCRLCRKATEHFVQKEITGGERIFNAIISIGIAEAMNKTIYTCSECGRTIKK